MMWFLHSKLLLWADSLEGKLPKSSFPWNQCSWLEERLCLAGARQVAPACISKPSVPLVTLIINDEFLADFQLRGIALPVVRSVLVCI